MRTIAGSVVVASLAACSSSTPELPATTPIAEGVTDAVADGTGLYWTTGEGIYTQGTGPEPMRLGALVAGQMFHDGSTFAFWDRNLSTMTVFPDTGGAVANYDVPTVSTNLCAVVGGAAYLQMSDLSKTLYRVDLSTGAITEQQLETFRLLDLRAIDGTLYVTQGVDYQYEVDAAVPTELPLHFTKVGGGFTRPTFGVSGSLVVFADNYETGNDFDTAGAVSSIHGDGDANEVDETDLPNIRDAIGVDGAVWVTRVDDVIMRVDDSIDTFAWDLDRKIVTDDTKMFVLDNGTHMLVEQPLP